MKYRYQYEEQNDWSFKREMKHNFYRFLFAVGCMAIMVVIFVLVMAIFFPEVFS